MLTSSSLLFIQPFKKAMSTKFPSQKVLFASWTKSSDIKYLNKILTDIARQYPNSMEMNVLVVGMPNVGKSSLLNGLRNFGIKGCKYLRFVSSNLILGSIGVG